MSDIILETLKNKLMEIKKERNFLWNKLQRNHYAEIIEIKKEFKEIVGKYGIMSEQAIDYANKNAQKEKDLFEEAKYVIEKNTEMLDKVVKFDHQINKLTNEISCREQIK